MDSAYDKEWTRPFRGEPTGHPYPLKLQATIHWNKYQKQILIKY